MVPHYAIRKAEAHPHGTTRVCPPATGSLPCDSGYLRRRPDRWLAAQLHQRGVPLEVVENALILAVARRLARPAGAPPLGIIRSLAYFSPVIEELQHREVDPEYFRHLRNRIARLTPTPNPALASSRPPPRRSG